MQDHARESRISGFLALFVGGRHFHRTVQRQGRQPGPGHGPRCGPGPSTRGPSVRARAPRSTCWLFGLAGIGIRFGLEAFFQRNLPSGLMASLLGQGHMFCSCCSAPDRSGLPGLLPCQAVPFVINFAVQIQIVFFNNNGNVNYLLYFQYILAKFYFTSMEFIISITL